MKKEEQLPAVRFDVVFATPLTKEELAKQELEKKIQDALSYLVKTNHKCLVGYIPKDGEDLAYIQATRDEALLFIRANQPSEDKE